MNTDQYFDKDGNMQVPPELLIDQLIKKNTQLTLEVATLQAGFSILQERIRELEKETTDSMFDKMEVLTNG